jgi:hypothetical protein
MWPREGAVCPQYLSNPHISGERVLGQQTPDVPNSFGERYLLLGPIRLASFDHGSFARPSQWVCRRL